MAATNRRQLLTGAAAYAAGAAIVAGGAALASEAKGATVDRSAWLRALRHYEAVEAEATACEEAHVRARARWLAEKPSTDANREAYGVDIAIQRSNEADDAAAEALTQLLNTPAPDADALAWKIHYLFDPEHGNFAGAFNHDYIKQTLADAVRLAGGTPMGALA